MPLENSTNKPRTRSPFRFDVVGSFLRPTQLKEARAAFHDGTISRQDLTAVEDQAITELVAKQKAIGLHAITDGEFRRSWWHLDFFWGLNGVELTRLAQGYLFHGRETRAESAHITGKINGQNHPFVDHYRFLKQFEEPGIIARQTIPAPAQFLRELARPENQIGLADLYPTPHALATDIVQAYRQVIADLYQAGCRSLQLDDCTWGMIVDDNYVQYIVKQGEDFAELAQSLVDINNRIIEDQPADLTITTHICRGNYASTWASSGGYEKAAPYVFAQEKVSGYYLEFDDERSGGFEPLRFVDADKTVVLGLFTSKRGELEDKARIKARIQEASRYVSLDQICLSPQCGFASTEEGNFLSETQQWEKLAYIQSIVNEIWA